MLAVEGVRRHGVGRAVRSKGEILEEIPKKSLPNLFQISSTSPPKSLPKSLPNLFQISSKIGGLCWVVLAVEGVRRHGVGRAVRSKGEILEEIPKKSLLLN